MSDELTPILPPALTGNEGFLLGLLRGFRDQLTKLERHLERQDDERRDHHRENTDNITAMLKEQRDQMQTLIRIDDRVVALERWKKEVADPAIDEGKGIVNRGRGALWLAGIGGVAGIAAAAKAFLTMRGP